MEFLVLSEKEVVSVDSYNKLYKNHILIAITDPKNKVEIPTTRYRRALLELQFLDINSFEDDCFDRGMAQEVLQFVNNNLDEAEMIIISCPDGISRSSAVASALSKILNHKDDEIFSNAIPNMFVYLILLDTYFEQKEKWSNISYLRGKALEINLSPMTYKTYQIKERK